MKLFQTLVFVMIAQWSIASVAVARDFAWLDDLSVQAEADLSGFRARLGGRFHIGDVEVNAVLNNVETPGDAYMLLRLGELSGQPVKVVLAEYRENRGKGWGALARSLGIKPGSREFHALKAGDDLYAGSDGQGGKGRSHGKGRGNGRGRGKGAGRD